MSVPKESVRIDQVNRTPGLSPVSLERKAAGYWVLSAMVSVDIELPDGRRLLGTKLVTVRCAQSGVSKDDGRRKKTSPQMRQKAGGR